MLKQVVFNKTTDADSLHNFMMVNFHHRQGMSFMIIHIDNVRTVLRTAFL